MKKLALIFSLVFAWSFLAVAQNPIIVTEGEETFGNTIYPGFWVEVPEVKFDQVKKDWKEYLEKGTKSKVAIKDNETSIFGAAVKTVSSLPVNVYSKFYDLDTLTRFFVSMELARDEYPASGTKEHAALQAYAKDFAKKTYGDETKRILDQEKKKLKTMERELGKAERTEQKMRKNIEKAQISTTENNDDLTTLNKQLEQLNRDIDAASTQLIGLGGEERATAEKNLNDLQKQKKTTLRQISSLESKNNKNANTAQSSREGVYRAGEKQSDMRNTIEDQRGVVKYYEDKLNWIKRM